MNRLLCGPGLVGRRVWSQGQANKLVSGCVEMIHLQPGSNPSTMAIEETILVGRLSGQVMMSVKKEEQEFLR